MMSFKNLALDRSLIESAIRNYRPDINYTYSHSSGNKYVCVAKVPDQKDAMLNVFYNSSGKTTLQV